MVMVMIGIQQAVLNLCTQKNRLSNKNEKTPLDWGFFLVWRKNTINEHINYHNFIIQKWLKLK